MDHGHDESLERMRESSLQNTMGGLYFAEVMRHECLLSCGSILLECCDLSHQKINHKYMFMPECLRRRNLYFKSLIFYIFIASNDD